MSAVAVVTMMTVGCCRTGTCKCVQYPPFPLLLWVYMAMAVWGIAYRGGVMLETYRRLGDGKGTGKHPTQSRNTNSQNQTTSTTILTLTMTATMMTTANPRRWSSAAEAEKGLLAAREWHTAITDTVARTTTAMGSTSAATSITPSKWPPRTSPAPTASKQATAAARHQCGPRGRSLALWHLGLLSSPLSQACSIALCRCIHISIARCLRRG